MKKRKPIPRNSDPCYAWCVYLDDNYPLPQLCRVLRANSIAAAVEQFGFDWETLEDRGYTCRRIVITEVKANEETAR